MVTLFKNFFSLRLKKENKLHSVLQSIQDLWQFK